MKLPPQIELRARCAEADDLCGLIFRMEISAGSKNPYGIFFPKTDKAGQVQLTAKEIEGQFSDHWEEAVMDYNGSIQDANDVVTIKLWDPEPLREKYQELLAWPLFTHQRRQWQSRREYQDYMISCRNDKFLFDGISVRLPETLVVYVTLRVSPQ